MRNVIGKVVDDCQTGKINQGNAALKRVVEAIANGDSYIPYRDSKLTMLLQVSWFLALWCGVQDGIRVDAVEALYAGYGGRKEERTEGFVCGRIRSRTTGRRF